MIFEIVDTSRDGSCVCEKIKIENEWSQLARVKYVQQVCGSLFAREYCDKKSKRLIDRSRNESIESINLNE